MGFRSISYEGSVLGGFLLDKSAKIRPEGVGQAPMAAFAA